MCVRPSWQLGAGARALRGRTLRCGVPLPVRFGAARQHRAALGRIGGDRSLRISAVKAHCDVQLSSFLTLPRRKSSPKLYFFGIEELLTRTIL